MRPGRPLLRATALWWLARVGRCLFFDDDAAKGELIDDATFAGRGWDERVRAPFVFICTQRTGSAWIMKTLRKQTCHIHTAMELFTDRHGWDPASQRRTLEAVFDPDPTSALPDAAGWDGARNRSLAFIAQVRRWATDDPLAFGFKWMLNQGTREQWAWFVKLCAARKIKLVFLHREDYLRMLISIEHMHVADLAAHPESEREVERIRQELVSLDTGHKLLKDLDKLEAEFAEMDDYARVAEDHGVETLRVVYEDIAADKNVFKDVHDFLTKDLALDAPCDWAALAAPLPNMTVVVHPDPPSSYVANWARVAATLHGSKYGHLLGDAHVDARRAAARRRRGRSPGREPREPREFLR